jgi:23S rRNA (guanosine2251-2'-O)-methyltransferase
VEYVVGKNPVMECLRAGKRKAYKLFVLRGAKDIAEIRAAAGSLAIEEMTRQELDSLVPGAVHQGVILKADPLPLHRVEGWLKLNHGPDAIVVALDSIEDPHNFGAITRSAVAFGAEAVLFAKDRAAPLSPAAVKAAAGGMEYIDLIQATNLVRALDALKEAGFWVAELDEHAKQDLWEADLKGRVVLVIGAEGQGVRRLVREHCDFHLRIPLPGRISTLNASVSAGIALAECLRQRAQSRRSQDG